VPAAALGAAHAWLCEIEIWLCESIWLCEIEICRLSPSAEMRRRDGGSGLGSSSCLSNERRRKGTNRTTPSGALPAVEIAGALPAVEIAGALPAVEIAEERTRTMSRTDFCWDVSPRTRSQSINISRATLVVEAPAVEFVTDGERGELEPSPSHLHCELEPSPLLLLELLWSGGVAAAKPSPTSSRLVRGLSGRLPATTAPWAWELENRDGAPSASIARRRHCSAGSSVTGSMGGGGDCDVACAAACTAAKALAAAAAAEEGEVMDECEGRASGRRRAGGTGGTSSAAELL
jgi:hypothetical protein